MAGQAFLERLLTCGDVLGVRRHRAGEQKGGKERRSRRHFGHLHIPIKSLKSSAPQAKARASAGVPNVFSTGYVSWSNGLLWLSATQIDAEVRANVGADAGSGSRRARPAGAYRGDAASDRPWRGRHRERARDAPV